MEGTNFKNEYRNLRFSIRHVRHMRKGRLTNWHRNDGNVVKQELKPSLGNDDRASVRPSVATIDGCLRTLHVDNWWILLVMSGYN